MRACCVVVFMVLGVAQGGIGNDEDPLLPSFSADEQEYQKKAWEGLIGCAIARHMTTAIYNNGEIQFSTGSGEGNCANGERDGQCIKKSKLDATSGQVTSGGEGGLTRQKANGGGGDGGIQSIENERLRTHCAQFSGIFLTQCSRISKAILSRLSKKKVNKDKVTRAKFEAAIKKSDVCKVQGGSSGSSMNTKATISKEIMTDSGCRARGDCTIHSPLSELVVSGNLTLDSRFDSNAPASTDTIPQIIHLMFGMTADWGGKPFGLVHYLCIKSASVSMPRAVIFLYYRYQPKGKWWAKAMRLARPIQVDPILSVGGKPILHMAHVSDLLRLQALRDMGGIYMDMDVISIRSFSPLMKTHHFVMGQEGPNGMYGLCNAVMLSAPNSHFVRLWIDHYGDAYDPAIWSMHSVKLPSILAHLWPQLITQVHERTFFYPLWDKLEHLFRGQGDVFPENIAMHLWESLAWDKYISKLSEKFIRTVDNNFNILVRPFLADA